MAAKPKKIRTVKELRKELKMTQVEFANKIGTEQSTVSMWERGGYKPSLDSYNKMAKVAKTKGLILEIE